ncbi:hypothetical protein J7L48_11135, partial [bacterium]|nr:hypothetical protein [bacterium]
MVISKKYFFIIGIFFIFSTLFFKISSPDFWWHMNFGRYLLEHGFPQSDPFSFVHSIQPYFQTFVSDILFFLSYKFLGVLGIYFIKFLVLLGIMFILKNLKIDLITMGLMLFSISFRLFARPEIFSFLFFSIFILIYVKQVKN